MATATNRAATPIQSRSFGAADQEVRQLGELGQAEIIQLGETTAVRATFEPGFRWTEHIKPLVGTDLCQVRHVGYVVSGRCRMRLTWNPGGVYTIDNLGATDDWGIIVELKGS